MANQKTNEVLIDVRRAVKTLATDLLTAFGKAVWLIVSYFWVCWWAVEPRQRFIIKLSARGILLFASIHFVIEVVAMLLDWKFLSIIHLPFYAKAVILAVAFYAFISKLMEIREGINESFIAVTVSSIFEEIAGLDFTEKESQVKRLEDIIGKILMGFGTLFREKLHVRMSVMLPVSSGDGKKLKTAYFKPDNSEFQLDLELAPGEGAAGKVFLSGALIYIPAIKYLQGIKMVRGSQGSYFLSLESLAYLPINMQKFSSLVCVPIVTSTGTQGVLNIDSRRLNAFSLKDFYVAYGAASAVAVVLDKYSSVVNNEL